MTAFLFVITWPIGAGGRTAQPQPVRMRSYNGSSNRQTPNCAGRLSAWPARAHFTGQFGQLRLQAADDGEGKDGKRRSNCSSRA
jgi:hypothetical protein